MPNLSKFNLTHEVKTTFEIGDLIPFSWQEVVPGDVFKQNLVSLIRLQPLTAPVMDRLRFFNRFYYVPYRLLMRNFERMLMKPDDPITSPTLYDIEHKLNANIDSLNYDKILEDYNLLKAFGISSSDGNLTTDALKLISAFPFYAYQIIYNYFYKDPVLDETYKDSFDPDTDFEFTELFKIRRARLLNDYFTTSVPSTQYGSAVSLDMDGNSDIKVNEMKLAERLQIYKEKLLLHGARYIDYLKTFFDTAPRSEVLQQPIMLGSGVSDINISDIDQMAPSPTSPLANTAGKSVSVVGDNGYQYEFKEHGIVLGLCFILPDQNYVTGIPRQFIKRDFYSFFNPQFSNIGLQETYGCELSADRKDTFGYNERYAELKYPVNVVTGDFRDTLDYWHFGTTLGGSNLNDDFKRARVKNNPFSVPNTYLKTKTKKPLSWYIVTKNGNSYILLGPSEATSFNPLAYDSFAEYPLSTFDIIVSPSESPSGISGATVLFIYHRSSLQHLANSNGYVLKPRYGIPLLHLLTGFEKDNSYWHFAYNYNELLALKTLPHGYSGGNIRIEKVTSDYANFLLFDAKVPKVNIQSSVSDPNVAVGGLLTSTVAFNIPTIESATRTDPFSVFGIDLATTYKHYNHCLAVFRNNITALRPLPKNDRILI